MTRTPWIVPLYGAAAALILMLPGGEARADVVGRPPPDCPAGSSPDVCHGGPFCRLLTCMNDGECNDGETCQDAKTCVGGIQCGGLEGGGDPPIATHEGSCEQSGCSGSVECQTVKQCLPSADPTSGGGSSGGGSATGTSGGGSATGGASSSGPTSSATGGSGSGDSAGSGDSTGGDGTKGCACNHAGESGGLVSLVALGLRALGRRRARR